MVQHSRIRILRSLLMNGNRLPRRGQAGECLASQPQLVFGCHIGKTIDKVMGHIPTAEIVIAATRRACDTVPDVASGARSGFVIVRLDHSSPSTASRTHSVCWSLPTTPYWTSHFHQASKALAASTKPSPSGRDCCRRSNWGTWAARWTATSKPGAGARSGRWWNACCGSCRPAGGRGCNWT